MHVSEAEASRKAYDAVFKESLKPKYGREAFEKVFGLVERLCAETERPARLEHMLWYVGYDERDEYSSLGSQPRRVALYAIVGDLCDYQVISVSPEGFRLNEAASEKLERTLGYLAGVGRLKEA